jgi:hypothetical protein
LWARCAESETPLKLFRGCGVALIQDGSIARRLGVYIARFRREGLNCGRLKLKAGAGDSTSQWVARDSEVPLPAEVHQEITARLLPLCGLAWELVSPTLLDSLCEIA